MTAEYLLVALIVTASAGYAAGRLLPARLVETMLARLEVRFPAVGRQARRWAGRPPVTAGAAPADGCSSCPAAATSQAAGRNGASKR